MNKKEYEAIWTEKLEKAKAKRPPKPPPQDPVYGPPMKAGLSKPHDRQRLIDTAAALVLDGWLGHKTVRALIAVGAWNTLKARVDEAVMDKAWLKEE